MKRLVALFLVLLLSIESFAAVVGDNDGAAFITKAEFDSLRNEFQAQIDQYNSSIDNKIDGAIAGYLAGVRYAKQKLFTPRIADYKNIKWMNKFYWKARNVKYTAYNVKTVENVGWEQIPYIRLRQIRQGGFRGWFMFQNDIGVGPTGVNGSPRPKSNGSLINWHGDGWAFFTPFWRLEEVNNVYSYVSKSNVMNFSFESTLEDRMWGAYSDNTGSWWNEGSPQWWGGYGYSFTPHNAAVDATHPEGTVTVNTPAAGEYLNMTIQYYYQRDQASPVSATVKLNSTNTNLGAPRGWARYYNTNWESYTDASFTNWDSTYYSYLPYTNSHFPTNNNTIRNNLTNVWKYFLLGTDDNTLCNVAYVMDTSKIKLGANDKYDFSMADTVTVNMQGFTVNLYNPSQPDGYTAATAFWIPKKRKSAGTIDFSYPLFPQIKHRDLTNGLMLIDGTTPAKVGDGLPLIKSVDEAGVLELRLQGRNYNPENTSATVTNQKVKLYVKKGNFATSIATDYYKLENSTTTLNGYSISDITKETVLKIPVGKDDEIWMRIGPDETVTTTNPPLYTQLSKIDMKVTFDG